MSPPRATQLGVRTTTETRAIQPEWRDWARRELANMPRGAQKRIAALVADATGACSTGYLADILSGRAKVSSKVGAIEAAMIELGATPRADAAMIRHLVDSASDEQREMLRAAAEILLSGGNSETRKQLTALLKTYRRTK